MPFGHCVHLWSFHISSGFVVTLGLNSLGTILLCLGLLQDSEKCVFGRSWLGLVGGLYKRMYT